MTLGLSESLESGVCRSQRRSLLLFLVGAYVALLPYLFNIGDRINFAPADCFLLLLVLLSARCVRSPRAVWSFWHLGVILTFVMGSFLTAVRAGALQRYEVVNKDLGLLLPFLSYAAITSAVVCWNDLRWIVRIFVLSVVLENVMAVGAFLLGYFFGVSTPFTRYEGLRLSGTLLDPNAYGGLLVVAFILCEGGSVGPRPLFRKLPLWCARFTLCLGILLTFSRSAWIGQAVATVFLFFVRPAVAVRQMLGGLLALPSVFVLLGPRSLSIVEEMASRPKQVQERFDLIYQALDMFRLHPFLGGGLGAFRLTAGEIAHNTALWFLADFGIAGLALFLAFIAWFFRKGWLAFKLAPEPERPLALALVCAHAAMAGLALGIEAFYQRHWWLIFGLIASAYSLALRATGRHTQHQLLQEGAER